MPRIMSMSEFGMYKGLCCNEKTLLFDSCLQFGVRFKTRMKVYVTLNKLLFPKISFLRTICDVITFPDIQIFFLPFD